MAGLPLIIAFDGECLMCSRSIRFLAEHDPADQLRFVRLQDTIGRQMALEAGTAPLDSVLVRRAEQILTHSDAVLAILCSLGGFWRILAQIGGLIPRSLRDALYRFIARHRYQWFGKGDACALPTEALRIRILEEGVPAHQSDHPDREV